MSSLFLCVAGLILAGSNCQNWGSSGGREEVNPGVAFRLTQKGIDFAVDKGLRALSLFLQTFAIPDIEEQLFIGTTIKLRKTNMTRCDRPQVRVRIVKNNERSTGADQQDASHAGPQQDDTSLFFNSSFGFSNASSIRRILIPRGVKTVWHNETFNPGNRNEGLGGVNVEVGGVNVDMKTHAETAFNFVFIGSKDNFDISMVVRDAGMNVTIFIGEEHGTFKLASIHCEATGDVRLAINGTANQNVLSYLLDSSFVQNSMFGKICDSFIESLTDVFEVKAPRAMKSVLPAIPTLTVDYSLTEAPIFGDGFIETRHAGTFQPTNFTQAWPFRPERLLLLNDTSRMVYVFVTDYTLNTLWQSLYLGGYLKWTLAQNEIERINSGPQNERFLSAFRDLMGMINSNSPIEVEIVIRSPPLDVFKISGLKLTIKTKASITFFTTGTLRSKILELETDVFCLAEFVLSGNKLSYNIQQLEVTSNVVESRLQATREELNSKISSITTPSFTRILRELGREGITLPPLPQAGVINLKFFENTPGVIIVGTDVDVNYSIFADPTE